MIPAQSPRTVVRDSVCPSSYRDRLNYWAIARLLPTHHWIIVARFRSRSDADGHLQFLRQCIPGVQFLVVFDLGEG